MRSSLKSYIFQLCKHKPLREMSEVFFPQKVYKLKDVTLRISSCQHVDSMTKIVFYCSCVLPFFQ